MRFKFNSLTLFILISIISVHGHTQVYLKSWTVVEKNGIKFIEATATNGFSGAIPERKGSYGISLSAVENILKNNNIFDHEALYEKMQNAGISGARLRAADVLCWDIHARTLNVPLHELIGTKRKSVIRYGDARWDTGLTPQTYADKVRNINLPAVKLHLPGTGSEMPGWANPNQKLSVSQLIEYLKAVRERNPGKIIAYDPHPQVSAAEHIDSVRPILAVCDSLDIKWIEASLPLAKSYWNDFATLRNEYKVLLQNEEEAITYEEFLNWMDSGAIDQICPGAYVHTDYGLTPVIQMIQWIKDHPERNITLNLHYPSIEHVHLAFTMTAKQFPYFEAPWNGNYWEHFTKVNLYNRCAGPNGTAVAPDWPGIYHITWLEQPVTGTGRLKKNESTIYKLYPNPVKGSFTTITGPGKGFLTISDIKGNLLLEENVNEEYRINTENFLNGLYLVNVYGKNSSQQFKLIVH